MARRKPRRTSSNKYAHLQAAQNELDFHDRGPLTDQMIHRDTLSFIQASVRAGHGRVRIVVGKGNHSIGAPRVGPQVRRTLRRLARDEVIEGFQDERVDRGGRGAISVRLPGAGN